MKLQDWFDYWWDVHSHHIGQGVVNVVDCSIILSIQIGNGVENILLDAFEAARNYECKTSHKYLITESVLKGIVLLRFNVIREMRCH